MQYKLKKDFYKSDVFQKRPRFERKWVASLTGKQFSGEIIKHPFNNKKVLNVDDYPMYLYLDWLEEIVEIRKWTEKEELEAFKLRNELKFKFFGNYPIFVLKHDTTLEMVVMDSVNYEYSMGFECMTKFEVRATGHRRITVKCSPHDEFSQVIGEMVGMCKLTNTSLPEWVKR